MSKYECIFIYAPWLRSVFLFTQSTQSVVSLHTPMFLCKYVFNVVISLITLIAMKYFIY